MIILFLFIFGCAIGSFLNVIIDRLPQEKSIGGRSQCDFCHKKIAWHDLIPVISFILLKGKCRYCQKKLSLQYPVVELITGTMFVLIFFVLFVIPSKEGIQSINNILIGVFSLDSRLRGNDFVISNLYYLFAYLGIVSCLIAIFFTDAKYHIIPDQLQVALFIFGIIVLPQHGLVLNLFIDRALGVVVVAAPIYFLYWITKGRGMGFGDVKLAFNIGLLLGIKSGLIALYIAFILGALVGLVLMLLQKRGLKSKIAFGPFLVLGILVMMLWKGPIYLLIQKIYGL